ncbi:hypothetical protein BMMON2_29590 [Burkholderia mallei]
MNPDAQAHSSLPTLETDRLWLRPRVLADLDACIEMDRDPDVTRHIAGPWADPVEHRRFVEHRITRAYPPGLGYWSIFEKARPDRFVGWVLLIPDYVEGGRDVEIGWRLVRASWGAGSRAKPRGASSGMRSRRSGCRVSSPTSPQPTVHR